MTKQALMQLGRIFGFTKPTTSKGKAKAAKADDVRKSRADRRRWRGRRHWVKRPDVFRHTWVKKYPFA